MTHVDRAEVVEEKQRSEDVVTLGEGVVLIRSGDNRVISMGYAYSLASNAKN